MLGRLWPRDYSPCFHLLAGLKPLLGFCWGLSWTCNQTDLSQLGESSNDSAVGKPGTDGAATKEVMMEKRILDLFTQRGHKVEISTGPSINICCNKISLSLGVLSKALHVLRSLGTGGFPAGASSYITSRPMDWEALDLSGEHWVEDGRRKGRC